MAVAKASQLAASGRETLLTCFNRLLADRLALQVNGIENLQVLTFHELCRAFAEKAGLSLPDKKTPMPAEYFRDELPRLLLESLELMPDERFDAIIVDEAQDFHGDWWETLTLVLKDSKECPIYVFNDPGQNLYQEDVFNPGDLQRFELSANLKNTKNIHQFAGDLSRNNALLCDGPSGVPVEFIEVATERERLKSLSRTIHRLIYEEGLARDQVSIITGCSIQNSCLAGVKEVGAFELQTSGEPGNGILVESAWRYKGLESPVVILTDFSPTVKDNVRYVAATRAQSHLIIIGTTDENVAWNGKSDMLPAE